MGQDQGMTCVSAEASVALRIEGVGDPTLTFLGKRNYNGAKS